MQLAQEGDSLSIAKRTDESLLLIITSSGTTLENQLHWLFGLTRRIGFDFSLKDFENEDIEVDFTVRFILDELGVDVEEPETDRLDDLLKNFGMSFPKTKPFSQFARDNLDSDVNSFDDPDNTLMAWLDFEESLFRRMERHMIADRIKKGFMDKDGTDVGGFIRFSLSVQNRRKSRAGLSLENHLEAIFISHDLTYNRGAKTENNSSPDFLFPGAAKYHDKNFKTERLSMLGVKTSCKDRWRQVLSEAERIKNKHLFTLEPGISVNQTNEMQSNSLQLVLPSQIHPSYNNQQRSWLMNLNEFISFVKEK